MRTCDAAEMVLRETNNPAVMWGDTGLLHSIASRAGLHTKRRAWRTTEAVLANLMRQPGNLVPGWTVARIRGWNRRVRIFWLPEHAPKTETTTGE